MSLSGSCLCESVKYTLTQPAAYQLACICTQCQKVGGGFGVGSLIVPKGSVEITGNENVKEFVIPGSEKAIVRQFCSNCGTHLFAFGNTHPVIAVHGGTLTDPSNFNPQIVIWGKSKRPYHSFNENVPVFDEYPPQG